MDISKLMLEKAPEEEYTIKGKRVIVRRDDLAYLPPLPPNSKMQAMYEILKRAKLQGYNKALMFAKKQQGTSYVIGLPIFCQALEMEAIIAYPGKAGKLPDWLEQQINQNVQVVLLHPNMVSINVNQAKKIAEEQKAYYVPLGFDDIAGVRAHEKKFSLPDYRIGTLITATMTGIVLAGLLRQIESRNYKVDMLYGISCGRPTDSVYKTMNKYIADLYEYGNQLDYLEITNPYERNIDAISDIKRWSVFHKEEGLCFPVHPDYEAKAWLWMLENIDRLKEPIYFINVGR
jgi:hypothetical protein